MTQYLLSVHSVDGEVGDPMTDEEIQQSWKKIQDLDQELKSAGARITAPPRNAEPTRPRR